MSYIIIGTCSICNGPVVIPNTWYSVVPPVPRCQKCGATPENSYGPKIPMKPSTYPSPYVWKNPNFPNSEPTCNCKISLKNEQFQKNL